MVERARLTLLRGLLLLLGAGLSSFAHGHALEPGYLELRQIDESLYAVMWKKPAVAGAPMAIAARLPEQCDLRTEGQLVPGKNADTPSSFTISVVALYLCCSPEW